MAEATPIGTASRMTIIIIHSVPTKAPSRPAEAGAARLSTLVKIDQAKPLEMVPFSSKVSMSWRA
jgi:hypothetical protein